MQAKDMKLEELKELVFLKTQEKYKELKQNIKEACYKYLEAKYIEVRDKDDLCLVDTLYEGDSFLLHLKFIEPSSSNEDPRIFRTDEE